MIITHHGSGCFRLQSGNLILLIDPARKAKSDVVLLTKAAGESRDFEGFVIDHAGEYEINSLKIQGWTNPSAEAGFGAGAYLVIFEDMKVVVLSRELKDFSSLPAFSAVDAAIVPAETRFSKVIRQLRPSLVIVQSEEKELKDFLKEFSQGGASPQEKITFKAKDLSPEAMKIEVLK